MIAGGAIWYFIVRKKLAAWRGKGTGERAVMLHNKHITEMEVPQIQHELLVKGSPPYDVVEMETPPGRAELPLNNWGHGKP